MANKKITELTAVTTLPDTALLTAVDTARSEGDQNVKITKANLQTDLGGTQNLQQVTTEGATTDVFTTFENNAQVGTTNDGTLEFGNNGAQIRNSTKDLFIEHPEGLSIQINGFGLRPALFVPTFYNASTNTPALSNSDTLKTFNIYYVSVAGTQDFGNGDITLEVGDYLINLGSQWQKFINNNQGGGGITTLEESIDADPVATSVPTFSGGVNMDSSTIQLSDIFGDINSVSVDESGNIVVTSEGAQLIVSASSGLLVNNGGIQVSNGGGVGLTNAGNTALVSLRGTNITAQRTVQFPDKDGTVAMLSDISGSGDLLASNNLSDLDNADTAIANLGITATATELNYVDGVTSNIQDQIDNISVTETIVTADVSGTYNIDWNNEAYYLTLTGDTTLTESNLPSASETKTMKLFITGDFALTLPANWDFDLTGEYLGQHLNKFEVDYLEATEYVTKINNGWSRNLLPDQDFNLGTTYWNLDSSFSIGTNNISYNAAVNGDDFSSILIDYVLFGDTVEISFEISGLTGGDVALLRFRAISGGLDYNGGYVGYANGKHTITHVIDFTDTSVSNSLKINASNAGTGGAFTMSNLEIRKKL